MSSLFRRHRSRRPGAPGAWITGAVQLIVAMLLVAISPAQSFAAGDGAKVAGLFDFLFSPPQQSAPQQSQDASTPRKKHKRPKHQAARERPDNDRPSRAALPQRRAPQRISKPAPAAATTPKVEPTFFVAVLGDNLGVQLGQGLQDAFSEQPEVGFVMKAKENSGIARNDYFDWVKATKDLLASKDHIDIAVMLIGTNDSQPLHDGNTIHDTNSDKWKELYAQRIATIARAFKDKKIPLVWIGIPIVRNERLASQAAAINEIVRTEATKAGATYIDSWQAFVNDQGEYDDIGPDATGQRVRLRAADGIHFTKAGARKLALFVEPDIRRTMENSKPAVDDVAGAPAGSSDDQLPPQPTVDINDLIKREIAAAAGKPGSGRPGATAPQIEARLPVPAPPLEPVLPMKPAAGAVMPLTAAPVSPGGELVASTEMTAAGGGQVSKLVERALVLGLPLDAKPGRSDDFRWPQR